MRNLDDGRVEVIAEGKVERLNEFLKKIEGIFKGYLRDSEISWEGPTGEFAGFDIKTE